MDDETRETHDDVPDAVTVEAANSAVTHDTVRAYYRDAAVNGSVPGDDTWGLARYDDASLGDLDVSVAEASLGCGNPYAMADLHPGETVLDLGSGAGLDVILSARRVAPGGRAYGLDFLPEMLANARANAADAGVENVEFLHGMIEAIPLPDDSVDVVISNCVINLAPDKGPVFDEIARVLRPGGRVAVSDVVATEGFVAPSVDREWAECGAGALEQERYRQMLEAAGLVDVSIEATHETTPGLFAATIRARTPG